MFSRSEERDPLVGEKVVKIAFTHHDAGVAGGPTNMRCDYDAPGHMIAIAYRIRKERTTLPRNGQSVMNMRGLLMVDLLYCEPVGSECSGMLYITNIFDANHPQTLAFLERTIRPNRLTTIRSLQLTWKWAYYPIDPKPADLAVREPDSSMTLDGILMWLWSVKIIAQQMIELRNLKVRVKMREWHKQGSHYDYLA